MTAVTCCYTLWCVVVLLLFTDRAVAVVLVFMHFLADYLLVSVLLTIIIGVVKSKKIRHTHTHHVDLH